VTCPSNTLLTHRFPAPADVLRADLAPLAMPGARKATLRALAAATLDDPELFRADDPLETVLARLRAVPGIGDWTAHYIALRALRAADAFPASDVGLLRGVAGAMGGRPSRRALLARAEAWRPQRAYAAQLLWAEDAMARGRNA
jgi:3-methyladenine DNA glycosylase/8-oxoguanine DNA glycosylase